jgi:glucose-1-phosphate adenylyltransferase
VRDSIVMFDSVIRAGAVVDRAILDKEVVVGQGAIVGEGPYDAPPNKHEPGRLNTGITVVGKRSIIPRGARLGRNVKVAGDVRSADFASRVVRSGESVEVKARPARGREAREALEAAESAS